MTCWVPTKMTKDPFKPTPPGIGDDEWMITVLGKMLQVCWNLRVYRNLYFKIMHLVAATKWIMTKWRHHTMWYGPVLMGSNIPLSVHSIFHRNNDDREHYAFPPSLTI